MEISSPMMHAVERSLDGLGLRLHAIANNIANISTPGYVRQEVNFEASLLEALAQQEALFDANANVDADMSSKSHADALLNWQPVLGRANDGAQRIDGNRVPVELEMSALALNAGKYNALASVISKDFQLLRTIAQAK
jgi:flagellar basal-body rod protein FlgB